MRTVLLGFSLLGVLSAIFVQNTFAAIYKYTDKNGTICIVDNLQVIPKEYRGKAEIVSGTSTKNAVMPSLQSPENKVASTSDVTEEKKTDITGDKEKIEKAIKDFMAGRTFKVIAVITGLLFAFVVIGKISSTLGHRTIGFILCFALTLFVLVYMFSAHLRGMVDALTTLKQDVTGIQKQAEKREEKVKETINELLPEPQRTDK